MKNRTRERFIQKTCFVTALLLSFQPAVHVHAAINQSESEVKQFESGQPVEREIAGGESHLYPIKLSAGQFMRVVAVQRGINIVIALADPDGKEIWEANFSGNFGGQESLSYEAAASGVYRIVVRTFSKSDPKGVYELRREVKAAGSAEDKKRIVLNGC